MRLQSVYLEYAKEFQNHFENTLKFVQHPLEVGLARERLLIDFLSRLIPERFGIGSGFVINSAGVRSKQIDIIIYDKIISPVFRLPGGVSFYPVECVVAVGEVKTTLSSKETLFQALDKIKSVLEIDRFSGGKNKEVSVHGAHGHFSMELDDNGNPPLSGRIFGFLFSSNSLTVNSLLSYTKEYIEPLERKLWPNVIASFNEFLIGYRGPKGLEPFPDNAIGFYYTTESDKILITPTFGVMLSNFLSVSMVLRANLYEYLELGRSNIYHSDF